MYSYINKQLHVEDVSVKSLAQQFGTPFYLYSKNQLISNFNEFKNSFSNIDLKICYALKANSNLEVIKLFAGLGAGADTVSEGEIRIALKAGIKPEDIVFSGVGKTKQEMQFGLKNNIGQFNVESIEELEVLNQVAEQMALKAPVSIRVNPDVDAITHKKITTGRKCDKFGIVWEDVFYIYDNAKSFKNIDIQGVTTHIGSQITQLEPYRQAYTKVAELCKVLMDKGFNLKRLDLGGGVGIKYKDETIININEYAKMVTDIVKPLGLKLILEPGRRLTGNAGFLISELIYIKRNSEKNFAIIDAGMNDLARPAIYGSYHEIISVDEATPNDELELYDVVGPVCESSDIFGRDRNLKKLKSGDLLAILSSGAYGSSMSSTYNLRPLIPEIMVDGNKSSLIRKRQTYQELLG